MTSALGERLTFLLEAAGGQAVVSEIQKVGQAGETSQHRLQQQVKTTEDALVKQGHSGSAAQTAIADGTRKSTGLMTRMSEQMGVSERLLRVGMATAASVGFGVLVDKLGEAVTAYVDLAGQVRNFQRASGASAEESSKFVAIMDDLQISAEAGTNAIGKLARVDPGKLKTFGIEVAKNADGNTNLTETLLNVADAYSQTTDPAERARLGAAAFGKSYQSLIPLLEQGRAGLQSYFDGVNQGQVYTQDALDKTKAYELALDGFKDALAESGQALGEKLVPALTDLLNIGAQVFGLIDSIPGPLISSALSAGVFAAAALGISKALAAIRGVKAVETLADTAAGMSNLAGATSTAEKEGGKLSRAFGGLNKVGAAGAALGAAIPILSEFAGWLHSLAVDDVDVDRLAKSLENLALTGQTGGAFRDMGGIKGFTKSLQETLKLKDDTDGFLGSVTALGIAPAFDQGTENIKGMDAALAQLVKSGNAGEARQTWDQLTAAAKEQGIPIEQLRKLFPEYAKAASDAGLASSNAADGTGQLADATNHMSDIADAASTAMQQLRDQIDKLDGGNLSLAQADIAARDAMAQFTDEVKKHKTAHEEGALSLDRATQAGRDNESALIDQIKAAQDLATATATATGSTEAGRQAFIDQIDGIRQNMVALGFNADQVNALLALYGQVPTNVPTTVVVRDEATGQLKTITQAANGLDGRTVTLTVKEMFQISRTEGVPLSVFDHRAGGGAVTPGQTYIVGEHRAELFRPSVPGTIVPNTGTPPGAAAGGALVNVENMHVRSSTDVQAVAQWLAVSARTA